MQTFEVTLYGTITRDIRHFEVDAESENEARAICADALPSYRLQEIKLKQAAP